jgi:hypothetical protein
MDFTRTFSKSGAARCRGASVAELLIALALAVFLGLAVVSFSVYSGKSLAGLFNYVEMQYTSRQALDLLSRDVRQCAYLQSYATNRLTLMDYDGQLLVYEYSPAAKTLTRTKGDQSTVLLTQCDALNYSIYKRSPSAGTFDHELSIHPASAKVISVSWKCSRSILGVSMTTDNIDAAKIVIRKN